jgi:DNA-binding XRE family transcriptional regulator
MQAVVKTPHIDINIKGNIPENLLKVLKEDYGKKLKIIENPDDELVDIFETDWYKDISKERKPGDALRTYRENANMTQEELGKKLGGVARQIVSNMERGSRTISLKTAKKLAKLFNVPVDRFV